MFIFEGHLCCFQFLVIMNKATKSINVKCLCEPVCFFYFICLFISGFTGYSLQNGLFSSYSEWGLLFLVVLGLLIAVASFVAEQTLGTQASVACVAVVANKLSRSAVCGIFPDQRSNPCPLHWQVDS